MTMTNHTPSKGLPRWLPFAVIAAGAAGAFYFLGDALSFQALSDNRETLLEFRDNNYLQTALAYIAIYVGIVAFSIPGATIATLAGGFMFGLLAGTVLTVIAATIGASLIFLAAKWGFGETLSAKMNASDGAIKSFSNGLKENELSYLFLIRLVPAVPFFVANLLPALVGVGLGRYVFTTFIGIIPGTAVYTWVGAGLGDVFAAGTTPNLGIIFEPYILGPLLGLGALALLPVVVKLFRKES